jgi:lipopolysaccharide export LptBFGC system permease protein LptF
MSRLQEAVEVYLTEIGQQRAPELGGGSAKDKGLDLLLNRLLDEQRFNRRIFLLIVVLLTTLFAVGIYFVLKNRNQPLTAGAFLGVELVSFLLVIQWIRQTLLDKGLHGSIGTCVR